MEILDVGKDFSLSLWGGELGQGMRKWAEYLVEEGKAELNGEEVIILGVPLELPTPEEERKMGLLFHQNA